ncbi:citrate synthase/methylcitrate synthase [Halomarina ordinaria]|uniref:Citrate synthase n=1 Tax=Halomarina ordinaria TaxID=3033939 RepID=A0ABD5U663_9EURY|nr:citrate synthase/methylcitrate synthase [Halomarina sp. PSRA2]
MTEDTFAPGLENVVAGETRLSHVDGEAGDLVIGGFPVEELAANATYEETLFLLWNDRLPTPDELDALRADLASRRALTDETRAVVRAAAEEGADAMDALRMGAAAASLGRSDDDPEAAARTAVARFPTVVATYWRAREGAVPVAPDPDLGHAENYLYMLTGEVPDADATRGLETYLNTVVDHGLNASTFTARTIASTRSDVISAVTGAVGALKGPLHGGAPGPVLDMLLDIEASGDPEAAVRARLDAGERIMGFGHRVYRVRDPRAAVLSAAAERFYDGDGADSAFFSLATEVEEAAQAVLAEHKPDRSLATNVEFYTALLLYGIGVPRDLFAATFGVARVGGWTAHSLEQLDADRLIRPRGRYVGERGRTWTPLDAR